MPAVIARGRYSALSVRLPVELSTALPYQRQPMSRRKGNNLTHIVEFRSDSPCSFVGVAAPARIKVLRSTRICVMQYNETMFAHEWQYPTQILYYLGLLVVRIDEDNVE